MNETKDPVAWTAEGHPIIPGATVYARKDAMALKIRKSNRDRHCRDCDALIEKGDYYGGRFYDHRCLNCVTTKDPVRS